MKKLLLLLFCMILLVGIPTVVAQPPFQQVVINEGIEIVYPQINLLEQSEDYTFHFHTINESNGIILNSTYVDCTFHLYNSTGRHQYEVNYNVGMDSNSIDWEVKIDGNNFSNGVYSYLFGCNSTAQQIGGSVEIGFEVTQTGKATTTSQAIMHSVILFVLLFLLALCLWGSVSIDGRNEFKMGRVIKINWNKYIKQGLFFFSYVLLTFAVGMAWVISENYLNFAIGTGIFEIIFHILWIFLLPIFIAFVVFTLIKFVLDLKLEDLGKRNLPVRS